MIIKEIVQHVFEQELNARCPKDSYETGTFKCPPSVEDDNVVDRVLKEAIESHKKANTPEGIAKTKKMDVSIDKMFDTLKRTLPSSDEPIDIDNIWKHASVDGIIVQDLLDKKRMIAVKKNLSDIEMRTLRRINEKLDKVDFTGGLKYRPKPGTSKSGLTKMIKDVEGEIKSLGSSSKPGFSATKSFKDYQKKELESVKDKLVKTVRIMDVHEKLDVVAKKIQDVKKKRDDYFIEMKSLGPEKLDAMSETERDKVMETGKKLDEEITNVVSEYNSVKTPLQNEYKMTKNKVLTEYAKSKGEKPEDVIYRSALGMVPEELIPTLDNVYNDMFRTTKGDHGILRKKR